MIIELLEGVAIPIALSLAYRIGRGRKPVVRDAKEPTCTGAVASARDDRGRFVNAGTFVECPALRSVVCSDGRCSYHCKQMCKCEAVLR